MNFGKGGQNIVRAGSNNSSVFRGAAGGILETYLNTKLRRGERDYHRQKDQESRIEINKANAMNNASARLFEGLMQPHVASNYYDHAFKTYGEDHPDVLDENKPAQANDPIRPEFAEAVYERGVVSGKHGVFPAQVPASVAQGQAWAAARAARSAAAKNRPTGPTVDTSSAIASSPVGGFNPKEQDIQDSLEANNKPNVFPFDSTVGSSGNFSPTKFDNGQPTFSELDAEDIRAENKKTPFDTKEGYRERTDNLNTGINEGKGGNK
jgi:hypothetical protein